MAITKEVNIVVKESGMDKVNQSITQLENAVHDTEQATKSFKTQMREANQELLQMSQKFGETSKEAVTAAKKVADLKDQMGLANDLVNSFNPDQKFKALGAATQVAGTGLQGVTAGMALFGEQSEDTQKTLLQVQAAMSFSDAISNLSNLGDQWTILKTAIQSSSVATKISTAATGAAAIVQKAFTGSVATTTTGFKLLRGAIIATGIGALVVGVGLLVANFDKVKKVVLNLIPGLAKVGDTIMGIVNSVTDFLGVTSETERAIDKQKAVAEKALKQNESYLKKNEHKLSEARKRELELSQEHYQRIIDGEMTKEESLKILREKGQIDRQKAIDEANKIADEKAKEADEKAIEAQNKANEKQAELIKNRFENENNFVAEQLKNEQLSIDEKRNIVLASQELSKEDRAKFLLELHNQEIEDEKQQKKNIEDLNKKYDEEKAQRLADTAVKKEELDYENRVKEIKALITDKTERDAILEKLNEEHLERMGAAKKTDREKELEEERKFNENLLQAEESLKTAKLNAANFTTQLITQLAGKNKAVAMAMLAIEKGLAIAQIVSGAGKAIANASANLAAVPAVIGVVPNPMYAVQATATVKGIAATKISAATSIASILAQTITSAKGLSGGGDGGGGGAPSAPQAPSFNLVQGTGRNQLAESIGKQAPVKAFVVSRDMSTGQEMDRNIIKSASL